MVMCIIDEIIKWNYGCRSIEIITLLLAQTIENYYHKKIKSLPIFHIFFTVFFVLKDIDTSYST